MRALLAIIAVSAAGLVVFSYLGGWHPAGDSFAVIRWPLSLVFAVCALGLPMGWPWRLGGFVAGVLVAGSVFMPSVLRQTASDYDFVLYQQNLLFSRSQNVAWIEAVHRSGADFITLQEVSDPNRALLTSFAQSHQTQVVCPFASVGGVAVLSRFEAVEGSVLCADAHGLAAVQVITPHGLVWVVSVHLHWPWPYGQAAQVDHLVSILEGLEGHVIVAGDFNAVAWSDTLGRMARASGTTLIGPHRPSFDLRGYPIGIDHVLTSPAYAQEARITERLGSDHNGVVAFLTRPRTD